MLATHTQDSGRAPSRLSLNDPTVRAIFFQVLVIGGVLALAFFLVSNTLDNLERRAIATGFHFLEREASFGIGESIIDYSPKDTYGKAFVVGVLNTLKVSVIGIVLATIIGTLIGVARLSTNWLLARLATAYVEVIRNIPPLLQLFVWYQVITESMPPVRQALNPLPGVFLSQRGITVPVPASDPVWTWVFVAFLLGFIASVIMGKWARIRQAATGQPFPVLGMSLVLILGLPLIAYVAGGAPSVMDVPQLQGFNFRGGLVLSPEFAAILFGLSIYTAAFIAEIVRGGILAVSHGQSEAAAALGLKRGLALRLVILPQALRVIVPPTTSQFLNLTKNSSLALAIGYPDLVSILNTTINQTGQAIEGVAMIMGSYLAISLSISLFMNWYNKRIALVER
ncbi:amino acid ABC transporter permease [Azospirillum sp.]|uniref:amino acid ABC transporter permease n=1 Tax=Azospirillum sp. TaxID=34012 RepID=UPI003D727EC4